MIGTKVGQYEITSFLGQGATGSVYQVRKRNEYFALKLIPKELSIVYNQELYFLKQLTGGNTTVTLIEHFIWKGFGVIVMEKFKTDLYEFLFSESLTLLDKKRLFKLICTKIQLLHSLNIYHRDVKPENIFMNDINYIRIGDFGSCIHSTSKKIMKMGNVGTVLYNSPEANTQQIYNLEKAEIWSIGILLYVICTGFYPYKASSIPEMENQARNGKLDISFSLVEDKVLLNLLNSMLHEEPDCRLSLSEVLSHKWLREVSIKKKNKATKLKKMISKSLPF